MVAVGNEAQNIGGHPRIPSRARVGMKGGVRRMKGGKNSCIHMVRRVGGQLLLHYAATAGPVCM